MVNKVENEDLVHFLLSCNRYDTIRKSLMDNIISKYSDFDSLNAITKLCFSIKALMLSFAKNWVTSFTKLLC